MMYHGSDYATHIVVAWDGIPWEDVRLTAVNVHDQVVGQIIIPCDVQAPDLDAIGARVHRNTVEAMRRYLRLGH